MGLCLPQTCIEAVLLQQLEVCASLAYMSVLQDENLVGILDCGQTVGNANAGAARGGAGKCLQYVL